MLIFDDESHEFRTVIVSRVNRIKVLEPKDSVDEICKIYQESMDLYKD